MHYFEKKVKMLFDDFKNEQQKNVIWKFFNIVFRFFNKRFDASDFDFVQN